MPSQAVREPYELVERIVLTRQYVDAYRAVKHGNADTPQPTGPLADMVYRAMDEMEMDDLRAGIAHWRAKRNRHEVRVLTEKLAHFQAAFEKKWGKWG